MSFDAVIIGGETLWLTPAAAPTPGQAIRVASVAGGLATLEYFTPAAPDLTPYALKAGDDFTGPVSVAGRLDVTGSLGQLVVNDRVTPGRYFAIYSPDGILKVYSQQGGTNVLTIDSNGNSVQPGNVTLGGQIISSSGSVELVPEAGGYGTILSDNIIRVPGTFVMQTTGGNQFASITNLGVLTLNSSTDAGKTGTITPISAGLRIGDLFEVTKPFGANQMNYGSGHLWFASVYQQSINGWFGFSSDTVAQSTKDVGLGHSGTLGQAEINNGTQGTTRDLKLRSLNATAPINAGVYTVATLPTPAKAGQIAYASDGRNAGEGAAAGTGCYVRSTAAAGVWKTLYDNSTVVA